MELLKILKKEFPNDIETGEYKNYQEYGKMVYDKYLTWEGTLNEISKIISNHVN
jgi:hypothetical protein